ncbi:inositol polyphosphate-5-phosphatase A-like [Dreissena polymorpha]|uniref:inositol-polyphosphate 5-phosphatase n=1 Tax=Dreissena polymorpha TaxID=45954 RepID=A0A9D4F0Q2_DREPO|nr:inositol polyphosphate-5-phosphatase A-like [Dreissena polymorpha]KAH3787856.1 hypothetical protein DPMN_165987 [Dreissena polymorpha]
MEADSTKLLLVTANVGSIFEDPEHMLKLWLKEFLAAVQDMVPDIVAVHCQEVGGKNYEASMQHVNQFVKAMLGSDELQKYDRARVFLDEDYTAADKFTALGNLYFIHECVEEVLIYDFIECKFLPVEGREVLSGNIENIQIKEKAKYPQNFFPDFKWSRKGFLRTRWSVNNSIFDLINIHLFHDASNIVALQKSPSVYCDNRYRALAHTLQRFETDQFDKVPYFIFGDFNFRLDLQALLKVLTEKTEATEGRGKKNNVNKLTYTDANSKVVLTVESKYFDHHEKHNEVFINKDKTLNKYDVEIEMYRDKVYEYDITFPPSYPFSEEVTDGLSYMKTRCPSWCDRILLSHSTKDLIYSDEKFKPEYNIIGSDTCMGDHKPVYLLLRLKKGKGNKNLSYYTQSSIERRKMLSKTISINGETVEFRGDKLNIHDFANFEKTEELMPEFRMSIKTKAAPADGDGESMVEGSDTNGSSSTTRKTPSFHDIARQVCRMESALLKWPHTPRTRHHSSSSEDMKSDDDIDSKVSDQMSVETDVLKIESDVNDVAVDLKPLYSEGKDSDLRQRKKLTSKNNVGAALSENQDVETNEYLHEQNSCVKHEHESVAGDVDKPATGRRRIRCPFCVVM